MAQKQIYVCVCMPRTMFVRCTRAYAAVRLFLLLVVVVCSVMLGANTNIIDVTQKPLCCNVLCENVGRVVGRVDFDNSPKIVCDQLLYKKVFELDVFGFL